MNKNLKYRFLAITTIVNAIVVILIGKLSYYIVSSFDYIYYISGAELERRILIFNLYIISIMAPFFIYRFKKVSVHFSILLIIQVAFILCHQIKYIILGWRFPDSISDASWWHSFFYGFQYVIPQVIIISIGIYFNQLLWGRKLLPTMYKNNAGRGNGNE